MRLGILGPAEGDLPALAKRAQYLLDEAHVDKVIYVADDDAMDNIVASWAHGIVGSLPTEEAFFDRVAVRCSDASPSDIDEFVAREHARIRLRVFSTLPRAPSRTVEILDGRVVVLVYDKAILDEDDIAAATILVYGKSSTSTLRKVGARTFVSPGPIKSEGGGSLVLDDAAGGVKIDILDAGGKVSQTDFVGGPRPGKMKVQGG